MGYSPWSGKESDMNEQITLQQWKRFRNIHLDTLLPAMSLEPGKHLDVQQILLNERINHVSCSSLLSALVIKR